MKKLLVLGVVPIFFVFFFFVLVGFINPPIKLRYNDADVDTAKIEPFVYSEGFNTSIMFPVDIAKDLFHSSISVSEDKLKYTVKVSTETLVFSVGSGKCVVNGREKDMGITALLKEDRLFVPIRFFAENCGKSVFWESENNTVNIFDCVDKKLLLDDIAKDFISIDKVQINDGYLSFPVEGTEKEFQQIDEGLNQKKLFNLTKKLIDKSYFLQVEHRVKNKAGTAGPLSFVNVGIFEKPLQTADQLPLFQFSFYGKNTINPRGIWKHKSFSKASRLKLEINKFYYGDKPEGEWIDAYYENKLKVALVELFGEGNGLGISEYLLDEYLLIRQDEEGKYNSYKKNRRFSDVVVDLAYGVYPESKGTIFVYFSY